MRRYYFYVPEIAHSQDMDAAHEIVASRHIGADMSTFRESIEDLVVEKIETGEITVDTARDALYLADLYVAETRRFPEIAGWDLATYRQATADQTHPGDATSPDAEEPLSPSDRFISDFLDSLITSEAEAA